MDLSNENGDNVLYEMASVSFHNDDDDDVRK